MFFLSTVPFFTAKLELGARAARNCQQRELSSMHDSNRATSGLSTGAGLELPSQALTAAEPAFREEQLTMGRVQWRTVSRVTDVTGHGTEAGRRLVAKKKVNLFRLRAEACDLHWLWSSS
jgi:hypothetical protein